MEKFKTNNTYRGILLDEMISYLEKNGTDEDRKEFAKNCFTKYARDSKKNKKYNADGTPKTEKADKLNLIYAKEKFCEKYAPELLPKKIERKKEPLKSAKLQDWLKA